MQFFCKVTSVLKSQKGQGLVEYGLILAGVVVVGVAVFNTFAAGTGTALGTAITGVFTTVTNAITGA